MKNLKLFFIISLVICSSCMLGMKKKRERNLKKQDEKPLYKEDKEVFQSMKRANVWIKVIKKIMGDNIDKILDNGEKLEVILEKAENLEKRSFDFYYKNTTSWKRFWLDLWLFIKQIFQVLSSKKKLVSC